jgi:hypothetical protein
MLRSLLLIALAAAALPLFAHAGTIYRCTVAGGATVFSQVPCGKDAATVGPGGAAKATMPGAPTADAAGDKAALAVIDGRCDAESHRILDGYSVRFAEANASIADLHTQMTAPGTGETDPAVQKKIQALEAHKTELLDAQDRELSTLRNQCQADRSAELKRQADRDATHVVKR